MRSVLLACLLLARGALAGEPVPVDIHAQPIAAALNDFAQQTGLQMLYPAGKALARTAPAVSGVLAPEDALAKLLADSGLSYEIIDSRTAVVRERFSTGTQVDTTLNGPIPHAGEASATDARMPSTESGSTLTSALRRVGTFVVLQWLQDSSPRTTLMLTLGIVFLAVLYVGTYFIDRREPRRVRIPDHVVRWLVMQIANSKFLTEVEKRKLQRQISEMLEGRTRKRRPMVARFALLLVRCLRRRRKKN